MEKEKQYSTTVSLKPFIHQVGGHSSIKQFDRYTVCKPLFSKELRFYQEVCPVFKPFIPELKGVVNVKNINQNGDSSWEMVNSGDSIKLHSYRYGRHCSSCTCLQKNGHETHVVYHAVLNSHHDSNFDDSSLEYLLLENVVSHFKCPCILDLKMGKEKHKDYVFSKEEADRRQARWDQTTSKSLGVRVSGMKVYLVTQGQFFVQGDGRDLTVQGFKDTMKTFLFNGEVFRYDVIEPFLTRLGELLNVMENQSTYHFYNSSLLLIYEGDRNGDKTNNSSCIEEDHPRHKTNLTKEPSRASVNVRMIDFAHVNYDNQNINSDIQQVLDESYLFGLRSVIRILEDILDELQSNCSTHE